MATPETASLAEIRGILGDLPGPDRESGEAAAAREAELTKPVRSLGRLEELAAWLATWQGRYPPRVNRPRVAVFAGNHGVAAQGVSAFPQTVTRQMVQNFIDGGAAVNQICAAFDADLQARNPHWGIRDLAAVTAEAEHNGLRLETVVEMPANNLSVVFRQAIRQPQAGQVTHIRSW